MKTESAKNIILNLSPKEYMQLIEWAMTGQSVYYTYHHPGKVEINKVNDLFQYLLEQGKEIKDFVQKSGNEYELTETYQEKIHRQMIGFVTAAIEDMEGND